MTVPMIIGMIMMMSFGLIDTFFVSLLGTEPLAAISFTFPVTFTLISLNIGLGIGTSAVIARLAGQGKQDGARETGSGALMLSFIMVGILALCGGLSIDFVKAERSTFRWAGADHHRIERNGANVHLLEDAGHWVHSDNPDGLVQIMQASFN